MNFTLTPKQLLKLIVPTIVALLCSALAWIGWQLYTNSYAPLVEQPAITVTPTEFSIPKAKIENAREALKNHTTLTPVENSNNPFTLDSN